MKNLIYINQLKSVEWGLNLAQASAFSCLYDIAEGSPHEFIISYSGLVSELPAIVDKPDTAYRLIRQLAKLELISLECYDGFAHFKLLEKAKGWGRE